MQKDAELNAESDKQKKDLADVKNNAEMTLFTAEKALKDAEGKIHEDVKKSVEEKVAKLKEVKELPEHTDGGTAIKSATEELATEMQKIGEAMAKVNPDAEGGRANAENTEAPKEGEATEAKDDNIKDAEVESEGDKKE